MYLILFCLTFKIIPIITRSFRVRNAFQVDVDKKTNLFPYSFQHTYIIYSCIALDCSHKIFITC